MSLALHDLSEGLQALKGDLQPFRDIEDTETVEIDAAEMKNLCRVIDAMHRLAVLMETELGVFRSVEAGRTVREAIEQLSIQQLRSLMPEADGNIIRLNFGGKKNDGEA
ncbi:hypothetical protein [Agrobacterium tumefaciens]|uniref:hypothetical protein n=1 Tax=Agrobacterium tumefaciens complex TaxID=1183400 RepID=UPI001FAACF77|nr:hypothetical protein [Agrobacterium tumefaciens]UNZ49475.1 hypothetical protein MLE07_08765 [Agrobacterium tumefaciens]